VARISGGVSVAHLLFVLTLRRWGCPASRAFREAGRRAAGIGNGVGFMRPTVGSSILRNAYCPKVLPGARFRPFALERPHFSHRTREMGHPVTYLF
jgi:hypothetical protein